MKKSKNTKNESFNTLKSREIERITWKVKEAWEVRGKPFKRDEKPRVSKGEFPLLSWVFYYIKMKAFYTMVMFFPQKMPFFSTLLSYSNFLIKLYFTLLSLTLLSFLLCKNEGLLYNGDVLSSNNAFLLYFTFLLKLSGLFLLVSS